MANASSHEQSIDSNKIDTENRPLESTNSIDHESNTLHSVKTLRRILNDSRPGRRLRRHGKQYSEKNSGICTRIRNELVSVDVHML